MAEVIYKTKEECEAAIATLRAMDMEPQAWMLSQLEEFKKAEQKASLVLETETPIWDTLQANYPYGVMPEEKKKCVESTVEQLLEEGEHKEDPGLLLGKIQCGKTDTFEDVIGLSFDKGVDVAIVITKGTKALVKQTITRMERDFTYFKPSDDLSQKASIAIYDIMKVWKTMKQRTVESSKIVIVCKKNAVNLDYLMKMFTDTCPCLKDKKVLVVDDEADFASRNYINVTPELKKGDFGQLVAQQKEIKMAKISQQIDDFRKIPAFCRYLQVTATPYCLYLQPNGELNLNGNVVRPFKPRFTSLVPIHPYYIGGQQYFVDSQDPESMYSHLYNQVETKCIDVLGHEDKRYLNAAVSSGNLYDMTYAIVAYFMATAVRRIQVKQAENKSYHTSAVIHIEIDKKNHEWQYRVVNRLIEGIKKAVVEDDQTDQRIWWAIDSIYKDFIEANEKGRKAGLLSVTLPEKEDVLDELRDIFSPRLNNYSVQMVNSDEQMDSMLDAESGELKLECAANIFIGGNILDRGVTIKNMLCFFYGRNPGNFQQDTVLQHARMYGARSKEDMAVMRFHTTDEIYKILVRMNDLDEQLRQWFIEGKDKLEPNAIFVGYDKNISPCSSQKIKASNALVLRPQHLFVPKGFWTGTNTAISKTVSKIENLITGSANYGKQDENGFFVMTKDEVMDILRLIETTYVFNETMNNLDHKNDVKEMLCALEYCADKSGGKVYVLHRTNRDMGRLRENGKYIDAPQDGRTDLAPSRTKAVDAPVVMLIGQQGKIDRDPNTRENRGWNNAPFYWPVLLPQSELTPVMFSLEQAKKAKVVVKEASDILDGINPEEVLNMTFAGNPEEFFGPEGTVFPLEVTDNDEPRFETRSIKDTTASRYIKMGEHGEPLLNPEVKLDEKNYHGIYSYNRGKFPFVIRPYKYILLRTRRDAKADEMLMELYAPSQWEVLPCSDKLSNGDLVEILGPTEYDENNDPKHYNFLCHTSDTILKKDMSEEDVVDDSYAYWYVRYKIKKILKFKKCSIDWDNVLDTEEERNKPINFGY